MDGKNISVFSFLRSFHLFEVIVLLILYIYICYSPSMPIDPCVANRHIPVKWHSSVIVVIKLGADVHKHKRSRIELVGSDGSLSN